MDGTVNPHASLRRLGGPRGGFDFAGGIPPLDSTHATVNLGASTKFLISCSGVRTLCIPIISTLFLTQISLPCVVESNKGNPAARCVYRYVSCS